MMPVATAPIEIAVTNVLNARGSIHVAVCPEKQFLDDGCTYSVAVPAHAGTTIVTVPSVPPGRYAAQAFHDENDNDKVDRGLFGIPKEGVGFSNDAKIRLGPPAFAEAVFVHDGVPQRIRFKLRYFLR